MKIREKYKLPEGASTASYASEIDSEFLTTVQSMDFGEEGNK
jgi:hypothetical protein